MYNYIKAFHIIFIVTWFSGMFYIVRLFIYNTEAEDKDELEKNILHKHYGIMIRRLWLGITWPSALLTLIFGCWMWLIVGNLPTWLLVKLIFVIALYLYHFSLHYIYLKQSQNIFKYSSQQLRLWNEVATIFLVAIVFLATVKQSLSWLWGILGLAIFIVLLMTAINLYKYFREKND